MQKSRPPSSSESREYMQVWRFPSSWGDIDCHVCAVSPVFLKSHQLLCICGYVPCHLNAWQPSCSPCTVTLCCHASGCSRQIRKSEWLSDSIFSQRKKVCCSSVFKTFPQRPFFLVLRDQGWSFLCYHYFRKIQRGAFKLNFVLVNLCANELLYTNKEHRFNQVKVFEPYHIHSNNNELAMLDNYFLQVRVW